MSHLVFATFESAEGAEQAISSLRAARVVDGDIRLQLLEDGVPANAEVMPVEDTDWMGGLVRGILVGGLGGALAQFLIWEVAMFPTTPTLASLAFCIVAGATFGALGAGLVGLALAHDDLERLHRQDPDGVVAAIHTDDHTREASQELLRLGARNVRVPAA